MKLQSCWRSTEWPTVFSWTSVNLSRMGCPPFSPANTSNPNPTLLCWLNLAYLKPKKIQKVCREPETIIFLASSNGTIYQTKTNWAAENRPSQSDTSIPTIHFQALCEFQAGYRLVNNGINVSVPWTMLVKHLVTFFMLVVARNFSAHQEKTWSGIDSIRLIVQNNTSLHHLC